MTYNLAEIMTDAWAIARQEAWSRRLPSGQLRRLFPDALRAAWRLARQRAAYLAQRAAEALRPAAELWAQLQTLENQDRLGFHGLQKLAELRRAYGEAIARERAADALQPERLAA